MNYGEGTDGGGETKQSPPTNRKRGLPPSTQKESSNDNGKTVYKHREVSVENGAYGSNDSPFKTLYKPSEQKNVGLDLSSSFVTKSNETIHNNYYNNTYKQGNNANIGQVKPLELAAVSILNHIPLQHQSKIQLNHRSLSKLILVMACCLI